jgi:flagellar motility protein MotE (MotC chaperone)
MVNGDAPAEATSEESQAAEPESKPADSPEDSVSSEDSILALLEADESVIEEIMDNLEALDYEPTEAELASEETTTATEDSLEEVNWLKKEKAALAEREKALDERQKELEALDLEVSKKLTTLEQAESNRIAQLARLYDSMDPRAVAKLAANLDDATVVAILPRMKPKNASQVLALLPAKRGAKLSKQMITIAGN